MPAERRQVTLSKADRDTPVGRELITLLVELSDDGNVSRDEMTRLRSWLEIDHGVDFPCLAFLHETIEHISSDGEVTEDELDRLALAIERVLPRDVRMEAIAKRRQVRTEQREKRRQSLAAQQAAARATREAERMRAKVLHRADFPVRGAFRFEERREACQRLEEDDSVRLEREPDNAHDSNAILVLSEDDSELGYVPREEARAMARLLDQGAEAEARVRRLWETPNGEVVPIVAAKIRRGDAEASISGVRPTSRQAREKRTSNSSKRAPERGCGCLTLFGFALLALSLVVRAVL